MMIIRINKKLIKLSAAIVLILSLGFNIYSCFHSAEIIRRYESLLCISNQINQTSVISFVTSAETSDTANKVIEIFDITEGKVIKRVQPNPSIQKAAISYINGISGMYAKVKAFPDKGYIIRIPLNPPVKAQTHWLSDYNITSLDEVFVLLPEQGNPFLLVLDKNLRPYFYTFNGNISILLKDLEFSPTSTKQ